MSQGASWSPSCTAAVLPATATACTAAGALMLPFGSTSTVTPACAAADGCAGSATVAAAAASGSEGGQGARCAWKAWRAALLAAASRSPLRDSLWECWQGESEWSARVQSQDADDADRARSSSRSGESTHPMLVACPDDSNLLVHSSGGCWRANTLCMRSEHTLTHSVNLGLAGLSLRCDSDCVLCLQAPRAHCCFPCLCFQCVSVQQCGFQKPLKLCTPSSRA